MLPTGVQERLKEQLPPVKAAGPPQGPPLKGCVAHLSSLFFRNKNRLCPSPAPSSQNCLLGRPGRLVHAAAAQPALCCL